MGSIVWLASYPGSGNTWMRILLSNLLDGDERSDRPSDINDLQVRKHAASRAWFDAHAGVAASDLTEDEIASLRAAVYQSAAREQPGVRLVKIHDALLPAPSGEPLVPRDVTGGVIYIIRNPLSVATSYAHHRGIPIDEAIALMADETHHLERLPDGISPQLSQRLSSWSTHVTSWVDAPGLRLHVARYEDMQRDPASAFGAAADFATVTWTAASLDRAIRFSAFAEVQRQEEAAGFAEGSRRAPRFFRRGDPDGWRDELTAPQISRIVERHGPVMARFGYLDARGEPA